METYEHIPVLLNEVLEQLSPQCGKTYIDATFGGGGYSRGILNAASGCKVVATDRDPDVAHQAEAFKREYGERFSFFQTNFSRIGDVASTLSQYSGIVFDLGVSSFQLENGTRGFSFQRDGPLDMRMSEMGITAAHVVNTFTREDLTSIIRIYGEEHHAHKISYAIVEQRRLRPFSTTFELASVVRSVMPRTGHIDPATKTFQALRIYVNDELREIQSALDSISADVNTRKPCTVLVIVVSFHSLEDRIVKNWGHGLTSRIIVPTKQEQRRNPRSRSARMRAFLLSSK
jgi:16S rRNA (cytosine1402-N4)-methyltransferase